MRRISLWSQAALMAVLIASSVSVANAADLYWWTTSGSGNWSATSGSLYNHWSTTAGSVGTQAWTNGYNAIFTGSAPDDFTVKMLNDDTSVQVANVTFATVGGETYKITGDGSVLNLYGTSSATSTFIVGSASGGVDTAVIQVALGGAANLTKQGAGKLQLDRANTYTGATNVQAGTLVLGDEKALQNSTLNFTNGAVSFGNLTAATIAGLNGAKTLTLTSTGGTKGVMLTVGSTSNTRYTGVIAGLGGITKVGSGKLTLAGANTYSGTTLVLKGTLTLENVSALQNSTLDFEAGAMTYVVSAAPKTFTLGGIMGVKTITLSQSGYAINFNVGNNNADTTYTGNIGGLGGINKIGTGILTLTGNNTYAGTTTVSSGTLRVASLSSLPGYNVAGSVSVASGAVLAATDSTLFESLRTSSVSFASGSYLGIGNRLGASETVNLSTLSSTMGFAKSGAGKVTVTGTSAYTAGTRIDGGNLEFATAAAVPASGEITINAQGALNVAGAYTTVAGWLGSGKISTSSTGALALTGNSSESISMGSYTGLFLGAASDSTYSGTLTPVASAYRLGGGGATLTVTGNLADSGGATDLIIGGNVALAGTSTVSGSTMVNAGVLTARTTSALAGYDVAGKISVASGAAVAVSMGGATGWTEAQLNTLKSSATFAEGAGWGIDTTNGDYTYSTDITGTTAFAKTGANALTLSGSVSYTGATMITAGELKVDSGILSGVISGKGNLTKVGSGELILSGINQLTGAVNVSGGTLSLASAGSADGGALSYASGVTINNGGTLNVTANNALGGYGYTTTEIGPVPAVTLKTGGLMTVANGIACYVSTLNLQGGDLAAATGGSYTYGSWTLRSNVNVTGGVTSTISATSVMLSSNATSGVTFDVASDSTLNVTGTIISDTVRGNGYGALVKTGAGLMSLTGANTYVKDTIVQAGTLKMNSAAYAMPLTSGSSTGIDIQGGSLVFDYTGDATLVSNVKSLLATGYAADWATGQIRNTTSSTTGLTLGYADDTANSTLTVMATYAGDFNLDGAVNTLDYDIWYANAGASTVSYELGDANYDGAVNSLDYDLWYANAGLSLPTSVISATPAPEPGTVALLLSLVASLGGYVVVRRRRNVL